MQYSYKEGQTYKLSYVNTVVKDNKQYIVATDGIMDYTLRPYDYQTEYSEYPSALTCYVRKVNFSGIPYFEQFKEDILKDRYSNELGRSREFVINDVLIDNNSQCVYYSMLDEYGIMHRYYPNDNEKDKKPGDPITLRIKEIVSASDGKNNARLSFESPAIKKTSTSVVNLPIYPKHEGKKWFGCEDREKEFKSSIVFPAGKTVADIDYQLGIICRSIAGFMNSDGGTLYLGVSDNGYVCGIEGDYGYLNSGDDRYTYKENDDCFLQKITNYLCKVLGRYAGTLVNMEMQTEDDHTYCVVSVNKANRPIWFEDNKLFVRIVTTNRKLTGDEITQFVLDRVSKNAFLKQKDNISPVSEDLIEQESEIVVADKMLQKKDHFAEKPVKAWRNITFFNNGEWSFQKSEIQGDDVVCTAVVPSDARQNNHILIIAYENGHVEAVSLKSMLYGKKGLLPEGKRRGQGLYLSNGRVVKTFCANKKDMLLLISSLSGQKFVKALSVDTLGIHDKAGMGNGIIREKGSLLEAAVYVPFNEGNHRALVGSGIFIEKNQKYTKAGVSIASLSSTYKEMINKLSNSTICE